MSLHTASLCCWQIRDIHVLLFLTAISVAWLLCARVPCGSGDWALGFLSLGLEQNGTHTKSVYLDNSLLCMAMWLLAQVGQEHWPW